MEHARRVLSKLFPSRCIVCQKTVNQPAINQDVEICSSCYENLPHNNICCSLCALPLPDDIESDVLCGRCIKKHPAFDYSHSLFRYEDEIISLVHQLKFGEKISYARSIGELLTDAFTHSLLSEQGGPDVPMPDAIMPDVIIPVPLHDSRLRKRGYNQSTEISRVVAKKTGIPIAQNIVIRQRSTLAQTGLKAKQRQQNIKGAFRVVDELLDSKSETRKSKARKPKIKHVLIVDDVITTGATVNELAKVLKQAGVERVGVLSIARAPLKH